MGRRAGKRRTEKRKLIYAIEQAKLRGKDVEPKAKTPPPDLPPLLKAPPPARPLPRIREQCTLTGLPPLVKLVARVPPTKPRLPSPDPDTLSLFPGELDRDLNWSPDEFDREYFRLWEEEGRREYRGKRDKKRKKIIALFGIDSDIERELERDRRKDLEEDLFGDTISTDEEILEERGRKQGKRMEEKMEVGEEKKEEVEEVERMEVEEEKKEEVEMEIKRVERGRKQGKKKEERMVIEEKRGKGKAKEGAGASRTVVPNKIRGHWLKSKTRLDLSTPLY